ncbi:MAG: DNA methyltransferase, partial [Planctomycetes bacterium]|nr:DNA methyltransferase [Planctomycetota bacterium]
SLRRTARLADAFPAGKGGKLKKTRNGAEEVENLIKDFLAHQPQQISSPAELAQRMARLTHLIRETVVRAFELEKASRGLQDWRKAFARVLIADLDQPEKTGEFADMFAQTLAYGLFSARVMDQSQGFTLNEAQHLIPKTNPFLRKFFFAITGPDMEDEPFTDYISDLVDLLDHTDMATVLAYFGKRSGLDDPIVHFYETYLAAYDPKLREMRGVYFTPLPVVSFIVRAVDYLLKTRFNLADGLADASKIKIANPDKSSQIKTIDIHKVLVLDPAAGTATFPYAVIDLIRKEFMENRNAGMWQSYVREGLLPRLFGFEILMAPYAVAHFKLALQLAALDLPEAERATWAYDFAGNERLNIFLTNTLEEPHEWTGLPLFTQFLANETEQANQIKRDLPIMVIIGNPPYSVASVNTGEWITRLVRESYYPHDEMKEANPKMLLDDYVKFIRWAQQRVEKTGSGVLAFITNHGYLDNPTFRQMRKSLMESFDEIYILNLHGNSKKKETAPDGSKDENVFDIQQGVAIGFFVKLAGKHTERKVYQADLWGTRESKYLQLREMDITTTNWRKLNPKAPFFLLAHQDITFLPEYEKGYKITDIFPLNSVGLYSARDNFAIDFDSVALWERIENFISLESEMGREKYKLGEDARDWKVKDAQNDLRNSGPSMSLISEISYRPFDSRFTYYTGHSGGFICMPRPEVMRHLRGKANIALCFLRRSRSNNVNNFFVVKNLIDKSIISSLDNANVAPLYIYPPLELDKQKSLFLSKESITPEEFIPNINAEYYSRVSETLGFSFITKKKGNLETTFGPEDLFNYIYAILH